MNEIELRAIAGHPAIENRADGKDYITGTAIVFGVRSQLLGGWFFEQIDARALDECDMSNVCGLFNHDDDTILGRTQSGTLTLEKTDSDLRYSILCDPTDPDHTRVMAKIRRGDVRGSSFAFMVAPGGADWDTDPVSGAEVRTVKKIAVLADVSPVVNPAYLQTSAGMGKRSLEAVKAEHDEFVAEHRSQTPPATEGDTNTDNQENTNPGAVSPSVAAEHDRLAMELQLS